MSTGLDQLKKLQAKTKEFKIPVNPKEGQEQAIVQFTALSIDDIKLLDTGNESDPKVAMDSMIKALAKSIGCETSDISSISMEYLEDLMNIMMKVNNIDEKDKEKMSKVKDMIAKRKGNEEPAIESEG